MDEYSLWQELARRLVSGRKTWVLVNRPRTGGHSNRRIANCGPGSAPFRALHGVVEVYHSWEDRPISQVTFDEVNDPISGFPLLKAVPVGPKKKVCGVHIQALKRLPHSW